MIFLQIVLNGAAQGCIYGLVAMGFVLIYKATETVSFAQGDLMMTGAFAGLIGVMVLGLPYWAAALMAIAVMVGLGLLLERIVIRPILGQATFSIVMLTIGIGYCLRGFVTMIPGIGTQTHALTPPYAGGIVRVGDLTFSAESVAIVAVTAVLCAVLYALFSHTRWGVAMQAASQNQLAASYVGIPIAWVNAMVWAIAAGLAGIAGLLLAPVTFVHVSMGHIALKAIPAAVIGGLSSLPGALLGGLIVGVTEALAGFYLPEGFKAVAPYVVMLVMLLVRPYGLLGEKLGKKV